MPLLVESLCPQLTSEVIGHLKSFGIQTVTAFVLANTEDLTKKTKIPYKDLKCIRHFLLTKYAGFPQRADSLYSMLLESIYIISTGSKRLDNFLKGGIYTGEVTEIYGPPGSGKTQFCISVAASLVLDTENTVLYLETNGNFTAGRMEQILIGKNEDKRTVSEKLQRIRVVKVRNIYHLFDVLDCIKCDLGKMENVSSHLKLIIVDSVAHLLSPCFGGKYLDGSSFINNLAQLFKVICDEYRVSILVCNNAVNSGNNDIKAGLGHSWKYVPSISLCIRKSNEAKLRKMTVAKSCRNGLSGEATFAINDSGITD